MNGLRLRALWEDLRSSLWLWPSLSVLAALALGTGLSAVSLQVPPDLGWGLILAGGGSQAARSLLETVAGSLITVTSLTFSLTVVALQLAASNYSPRLLRTFLRDTGNQVVLSVFLATFAYSYAVLRALPSGEDAAVPVVAVNGLLPFVLATLAALVYFIHHLTQTIRVESILDRVQDQTLETVEEVYPEGEGWGHALPDVPERALRVHAQRPGHLQAWDLDALARWATEHDLAVRLRPKVGEHLIPGTVLAWVWPPSPGGAVGAEDARRALDRALQVGKERTAQQDVLFGIRQLVDIALRALSPGVNDPTTANQAIDRLGVVLAALTGRRLSDELRHDDAGVLRVAAPVPTFREHLDLVCDQILHYGGEDAVVTARLRRVLTELASLPVSPERRRDLAAKIEAVNDRACGR